MRVIAEYAMRGRREAAVVAAVSAAIPFLFWFSAATVVLVTLRKGLAEGLSLMLWAGLPAVFWLVMSGDPTPFIVIVGAMILAVVLRTTVSWVKTLLMGIGLGLIVSWIMPLFVPEFLNTEMLRELVSPEKLKELVQDVTIDVEPLYEMLSRSLIGFWAATHLLIMVLSVMLGRWWQSLLFNPGGFGDEFRQLLLPPSVAVPIVLVVLFGGNIHPALIGWTPVLMVPLLIAAIALTHGIVHIRKLSIQWLVLMYLVVFLVGVYIAVADSLMNFRRRLQKTSV